MILEFNMGKIKQNMFSKFISEKTSDFIESKENGFPLTIYNCLKR